MRSSRHGATSESGDLSSGVERLWVHSGVGNTFGDTEAFRRLIDNMEHQVFDPLPDETWFYPGHGDDSTLGAERPHLAEWRARGWWNPFVRLAETGKLATSATISPVHRVENSQRRAPLDGLPVARR